MINAPLVFVIVLNYNGINYLKTCLSSLEQQSYQNYKIIVFDNASKDTSVEFIQSYFPKVKVIEGVKNFGFAEGNNLATKFALDNNADYVLLVNNDTKVNKDLIEKLICIAESNDLVGVVGPEIFDLKNEDSIQEMGMAIDRFGYPFAIKNKNSISNIFFVSGCAMLIKSELIRKIGLFDKKYFMFAEDLDFCWRAQLAGHKIILNKNAKIYHASGGSISGGVIKASSYKTSAKRVFLRERNTIRTLIKNYDLSNLIKIVPFYIALLVFETIFWSIILKPETSKNILKAIFWNLKILPDTIKQRTTVQNLRRTKDDELVAKMLSGYCKLSVFRTVGVPSFTGN